MSRFRVLRRATLSPALLRDFTRRSLVYCALYGFFALPIIKANYFYIDDLGRSLDGHTNWGMAGRPFASFLMEALNFNRWTLTDLAPLPQLLAIALLGMATAWTSLFFRLRFGFGLLSLAVIVCNPFFLENLSYRFDALTMGAAMCLTMAPFGLSLCLDAGMALYGATFLCLFASLNLYQPALNVFIVLALFAALLDARTQALATAWRGLIPRLACLAAALAAYKIESFLFPFDRYASKHAGLAPDNISVITANLRQAYDFLSRNLFHTHQTQALLGAMLFGTLCFFAGLREAKPDAGNAAFAATTLISAIFLLGMAEAIVGPLIFLKSAVWAPRVMIGFGAFGACLLALAALEWQDRAFGFYVSLMLCVVFLAQCTISYAYGNALHAQGALDSQIASSVAKDAALLADGRPAVLSINGVEPVAPNALLTMQTYPTINALLPLPLHGGWYWGGVALKLHGLPDTIKFLHGDTVNKGARRMLATCRFSAMIKSLYYDIYEDGGALVVDFTKRCGGTARKRSQNGVSESVLTP